MWIHLLSLGLIDGAGGNPEPVNWINDPGYPLYEKEIPRRKIKEAIEAAFDLQIPIKLPPAIKAEVVQQKNATKQEWRSFEADFEAVNAILNAVKIERALREQEDEETLILLM